MLVSRRVQCAEAPLTISVLVKKGERLPELSDLLIVQLCSLHHIDKFEIDTAAEGLQLHLQARSPDPREWRAKLCRSCPACSQLFNDFSTLVIQKA